MRFPIVSALTDAIFGKGERERQNDEIYLPAPVPDLDKIAMFNTPEFQEPHYRHAELNLRVESKESMINAVWNSHLSYRCKSAFTAIIESYYDRNILLSNLTGKKIDRFGFSSDEKIQIAYWRTKIDVMSVDRCNAYKSDRMNPEFTKFEQLILSQIWYRLTRTKDKDRERIASGRIQINYQAKQEIDQQNRMRD